MKKVCKFLAPPFSEPTIRVLPNITTVRLLYVITSPNQLGHHTDFFIFNFIEDPISSVLG